MRLKIYLVSVFALFSLHSFSQEVVLFQAKEPINVRATGSIKAIKKNSNDSTLVTGKFEYQHGNEWITVPVSARVRGNFRLKYCYFPPLKLKFKKQQTASTVFAGNKSLKLVLPCKNSSDRNELIAREYLCYQFYQVLSAYYFNTRLAKLELTELSRKKPHNFSLLTFFVEDNSLVANRAGGDITEVTGVGPGAFEEKQSVRNDFFQYMIGNADWSAVYQHNSNTLVVDKKLIPLSYDFDMSGFVNAAYAQANPTDLGTGDVRERVYRGFCKSTNVMQEVRTEYLQKEDALYEVIDQHAAYFKSSDIKEMKGYLGEFFEILKKDFLFDQSIVQQCRTK